MTVPATVAHAVQQTQVWLKELRDNADLADEATALSVLRAVLHQLRDRLSVEEAVDFAAQLPTLIRGIYFEGWRPASAPQKVRTKQVPGPGDTKAAAASIPPEPAVRDVFALIAHHCDPGEIGDVIGQMPSSCRTCGRQRLARSSSVFPGPPRASTRRPTSAMAKTLQ
jgi:uncharacterized protein (DUF2267 family)